MSTNSKGGRDEFSDSTRLLLAKRAGYMCSVPTCRKLTIGPSEDRVGRVTSLGVAAHITAASDDGPRYDKDIGPEERKSEFNGIWVCQNHGKGIDDNASVHTVAELQRWKKQHEDWVFSKLIDGIEGLDSGIQRIRLQNIGRFETATEVEFGKNSVLLSGSGGGKTTVCQTLAAFSGGEHFESFQQRFSFNDNDHEHRSIGLEIIRNGAKSSVTISQIPTLLPNRSKVVKVVLRSR